VASPKNLEVKDIGCLLKYKILNHTHLLSIWSFTYPKKKHRFICIGVTDGKWSMGIMTMIFLTINTLFLLICTFRSIEENIFVNELVLDMGGCKCCVLKCLVPFSFLR
jgi:hypothetical protein